MVLAATGANAKQIEYWNGPAGERWAARGNSEDARLSPFGAAAMEALDLAAGQRILDIGCGCGGTTLTLAERVRPSGQVTGVDVSGPMLVEAEKFAEGFSCRFIHADAAAYDFEPRTFDRAFSRFGVMFFEDPVTAFSNIRTGLKPGGRIAFAAWQGLDANPWAGVTIETASRFVERPKRAEAGAPGPYAFADPARFESVLGDAGFTDIDVTSCERRIEFGADAPAAAATLIQIGPMAAVVAEAPDEVRGQAVAALAEALTVFEAPDDVTIPAAAWIAAARNPG